jgi:tetratricopeptide (TPR) repeat protein
MKRALRQVLILLVLSGWAPASVGLQAAELLPAFDQANRLYEQRQFSNAAAGYEQLIQSGHGSATLYFNLGNAWFKAGQKGHALAAYRQAQQLAPRDPSARFNLQFVRKQVTGSDTISRPLWKRFLSALTLNEWTILATAGWWLWLGLLALREFRPDLRSALRGYTTVSGLLLALLGSCLGAAIYQEAAIRSAVVVVPSAVVRRGPLEESQVFYQMSDGSEVTVLDEKQVSDTESWLQVRDDSRRIGWLKRDQVVVLRPAAGFGGR